MRPENPQLQLLAWILFLLAGHVSSGAGMAQTGVAQTGVARDSLGARIDHLLKQTYPADEPGAAVIVVDDGEVVYRGARGMANLELDVALEPDNVFRLGSITKQFTATAILLLEEQGKLSVHDPISKALPDYPVHGHTITIEHLLTHTSGIFSYTSIPGYMSSKVRKDMTTEELIDEFENEEMEFAPGERWSYSNSGYVLLGAIIEKVSGTSYAEFVEQNIFEPLGMTASEYGGHQLIPKRASGYARGDEGYVNARYLSMTQPHAAGSLLSTVDDLARWDQALYGDDLLPRDSRQRMFTATQLNDGEATTYGYGFATGSLQGTPSISHGGGIFGFSTFAVRLPEEGVYVAVLSNGSPKNPGVVGRKLAALAIGKPFQEWHQVEVDAAVLEGYVGVYRLDDDSTRTLTVEDGRLYFQGPRGRRREALPHSATGFFFPKSLIHFEIIKNPAGAVDHILIYANGGEPISATRTEGEQLE